MIFLSEGEEIDIEPFEDASGMEQFFLNKAAKERVPVNGSIELLPLCNLNCRMCYVRLSRQEQQKLGRIRTAAEWLKLGRQMQQCGTLFLLLTGGEPLLHPEFQKIYLGLKKLGMILTINTNGTLIDEAWADFFDQHRPRRINITLYGKDDATYQRLCGDPNGFTKTIRAIHLLCDRSIPVKISISLTPENRSQLTEIHKIGDSLGIPVRVDTYMMPANRERTLPFDQQNRLSPTEAAKERISAIRMEMNQEEFTAFAKAKLEQIVQGSFRSDLDHMSCLAGRCSFAVNWLGNLHPCVILSEPSEPLFEQGFAASWKSLCKKIDQIRLSSTCASCHLRPLCRTCAASALTETGQYDGIPNYMCQYAKESLRLLKKSTQQEGDPS